MAVLVDIVRNQEALQGFQIQSSQDMHDVLSWGVQHGYTGHINLDANGNFTLQLTSPNGDTSQSAVLGDWVVVKNGVSAILVPAAQAGALYSLA